ncbi:MAG: DUF6455 family protein [Pseudomonadota bacterium]
MQSNGPTMHHWRLVNRMAKATHTDLVAAFDEGRLSSQAWADMVQDCRGCTWADGCVDWLAEHDTMDTAPRSCVNRARFAALNEGDVERLGDRVDVPIEVPILNTPDRPR